jgi:hypothetical protein
MSAASDERAQFGDDLEVAVIDAGQAGPAIGYFLRRWQHTRGAALIGWVKDDAQFIAERITEYQQSKAPARRDASVGAGQRR